MAKNQKQDEADEAVGVSVERAHADELQAAEPVRVPSSMGATFAERAAAREKAVKSAENKSVDSAESK